MRRRNSKLVRAPSDNGMQARRCPRASPVPLGRLLVASERPIFLSTGKVGMAERALAGFGAFLGV